MANAHDNIDGLIAQYEGGGSIKKYKKGGKVEEDGDSLEGDIARMEKEKGPDWHNKMTADDLSVELKYPGGKEYPDDWKGTKEFITGRSRKELRIAKRQTRKAIRKSKRQTTKAIRKKSKEDTAKRLEATKTHTLDGSKWKHKRDLKRRMRDRRKEDIKAERARKRKAIKSINRIGALTGE